LLRLIDTLADDVGATVVLATNVGVRLQCLHVVRRDHRAPHQGDLLPLLHTAEGLALLLTAERELVRKYVHRLNSEVSDESERVQFDNIAADLDAGSARGYVRLVDDQSSSFALLIPNADRSEQLALCVRAGAGASEDVIVRAMRGVVSQKLGLVGVPSPLPPQVTAPRQLAHLVR
jgi:DNA-binding IclR family transcriptional regulator